MFFDKIRFFFFCSCSSFLLLSENALTASLFDYGGSGRYMGTSDYKGGTNPINIILFCLFFGSSICIALLYLGYFFYQKKIKINILASRCGLSSEEMQLVTSAISNTRFPNPGNILGQREEFDSFMNRYANYHFKMQTPHNEELEQAIVFRSVRKKANFMHSFHRYALISSRALPKYYPLQLVYTNPNDQKMYIFHTQVLHNYELFLGIEGPEEEVIQQIPIDSLLEMEVLFQREERYEYQFPTRFICKVTDKVKGEEKTIWYLDHSRGINKWALSDSFDIPVQIKQKQGESEEEYDKGEIITFDTHQCVVCCQKEKQYQEGDVFLFQCTLKKRRIEFQATVLSMESGKESNLISFAFVDLSSKLQQQLIRFIIESKRLVSYT